MKRKWLAVGISVSAVVLLILTSLTNVIGYQTVRSSQQQTIKEAVNQQELLFQTICDMANNKEMQRIILKSQMNRGIFPVSEIPVITKNQVRQMYLLSVLLSRFISIPRIHSMVGKYQFDNQELRKEISIVIEADMILKGEITLLKNSECDCENEFTALWHFPIVCSVLLLLIISLGLLMDILPDAIYAIYGFFILWLTILIYIIGGVFNCRWYTGFDPPPKFYDTQRGT